MDTTKTVTHISLCAGYGGIDLGLKRAIPALRTVAFSEIEAFACANLVAKMEAGLLDPAPIWSNLKTFPWDSFRDRVDILSGGYPCQPFSSAGKRLGTDDPRHLWPFIADGIARMRPRICFFENVEGHITLGLREVIAELESLGYRTTWGIFSAAEVGAPHQRKRVFILAHKLGSGLERHFSELLDKVGRQESHRPTSSCRGSSGEGQLANPHRSGSWQDWQSSESRSVGIEQSPCDSRGSDATEVRQEQAWPSRPSQPQFDWEPPRTVGDTASLGPCGGPQDGLGQQPEVPWQGHEAMGDTDSRGQSSSIDTRCGGQTIVGGQGDVEQAERWQTEPALGRDADGSLGGLDYAQLCVSSDNRTDELRLLGNGVVPATAERAFRVLVHRLIQ